MINESNFKMLCLKDDDWGTNTWFFKDEIIECNNGFLNWKGSVNFIGNIEYKSYDDFITNSIAWNSSYFKLIEVDGHEVSDKGIIIDNNIITQSTKQNMVDGCKCVTSDNFTKINNKPVNSKQFEKLFDSNIINSDMITLNSYNENTFKEYIKNNEELVYIDEYIVGLNYEQCVQLYKWLQKVCSYVESNKPVDITKEEIEKKLGYKINIVE